MDSISKTSMISYTEPIYLKNQLVGVAGIDMSFDDLKKLILSTKLYDTGNAFLLSNNYDFLVDKYSKDTKFVDNLMKKFNSTSEELLATIKDILKVIENVDKAPVMEQLKLQILLKI
ncbi:MAG: cache domain-containing protein [Clostridium sp.]|uniref:hypothetical protein n=1 Tax=Clostridium sp. TaxID=1506 RepID=UPI0025C655A9|nr:hypothetical protein [Clostridium sp.]MCH3963293.1 cache domain-containing protein [Clostridium sp.]